METESKSASQHSKTLFFINIKSISVKEVNLSTKGHRHILKDQSKNKKLLKLVSAIFYQIFIFSQNDSPLKTMKNVFYFI